MNKENTWGTIDSEGTKVPDWRKAVKETHWQDGRGILHPAKKIYEESEKLGFVFNDGGREKAGYKGFTGDCVTRALAISLERPYQEIYGRLDEICKNIPYLTKKGKPVKKWGGRIRRDGTLKRSHPRTGVHRNIIELFLDEYKSKGYKIEKVATNSIGQKEKVHMLKTELPKGRLLINLSGHISTVIDHVSHDTYDCTRLGNRMVYGYWIIQKPESKKKEKKVEKQIMTESELKKVLKDVSPEFAEKFEDKLRETCEIVPDKKPKKITVKTGKQFDMKVVRSQSLKVMGILSEFKQHERRRILDHCKKINEV